jgi:hypothetical protein
VTRLLFTAYATNIAVNYSGLNYTEALLRRHGGGDLRVAMRRS